MQLVTKDDYIQYFVENARLALEKNPKFSAQNQARIINCEISAYAEYHTALAKANIGGANKAEVLANILTINYSSYIAMLELRNDIWEYEYMAFSRRIGELWEKFIKLIFDNALNNLHQFLPPQYEEVERHMRCNFNSYIEALPLTDCHKKNIIRLYDDLLQLLCSGDINLSLDIHFTYDRVRYNIDLKSGFGSNEKGNMNRLLLVASIYKTINENYKNILLVRAPEATNNNYFRILKNSGKWEAYCSNDAYSKIKEFTGYDLSHWIANNIAWKDDFSSATYRDFKKNKLLAYLDW